MLLFQTRIQFLREQTTKEVKTIIETIEQHQENLKKLREAIGKAQDGIIDSLASIRTIGDQNVEMVFGNAKKMHELHVSLTEVLADLQIIKRDETARTQDEITILLEDEDEKQ